ncbi:snRNA-activating protein complex subunit 3, partial [Ophiophagus hannah]
MLNCVKSPYRLEGKRNYKSQKPLGPPHPFHSWSRLGSSLMPKMAGTSSGSRNNIPNYETVDLNTRVFHVGAFGALWKEALRQEDVSLQQAETADDEAAVMEDLLCTPEIAAELKAVCSIAALKSSDKEDTEVIPEDTNLITLKIRQKALERREETILVDRACRQETFIHEMESHAIGKRPKDPGNMIDEAELVLTLNIFYPVIFQKHKLRKPYQTLLVLGSQKLTELRDCISCVSDLQIGGEFSNNPAQAPENISKDLYKSAFFYFEGVFYNDSRYAECRDLSRQNVNRIALLLLTLSCGPEWNNWPQLPGLAYFTPAPLPLLAAHPPPRDPVDTPATLLCLQTRCPPL